ncbi:response regulator [Pleurocapsa sp. PCC 7319]|uniref:response regulator n=1 Tax=Pleurocapsa sp. PCC 7319 TaxID=118161 RepID=UPI00034DA803|nr:response regulator [Pleurocapsa sp. PCC 7319]
MTAELTPNQISVNQFTASKQIQLFKDLKQGLFSGQVIIKDYQANVWTFFLYFGRILYVTGGTHPVRRWRRNLAVFFPQITAQLSQELASTIITISQKQIISWDYQLLYLWVEQGKANREQATKMIRSIVTEVLFDITQAQDIVYSFISESESTEFRIAMIDSEQQVIEAWKIWQQWQQTKIADSSPNLAPIIKQLETLPEKVGEKTYQTLSRFMNGKQTLRDLAIRKQTDLILATRSIIPYIQLGLIELIEIDDLPLPIKILTTPNKQASPSQPGEVDNIEISFATGENDLNQEIKPEKNKLLVACIDKNAIICQIIKKIITNAGYAYVSYNDPLQAIAAVLDSKPDLVFINVELTEISGYDVCNELRQLEYFHKTPIILFSKNINLVDRMKAKMAGCSELFNQPLDAKSLLSTIDRYAKI